MVAARDAAGLLTTTVYDDAQHKTTVIAPGGATRCTTTHLDGQTQSETGTAVVAVFYEYGVLTNGWQWTKTSYGETNSARWTKIYTDLLGRTVKEEQSWIGAAMKETDYTYANGRPTRKHTNDGTPDEIYEYDAMGNRVAQGSDVNDSDALDAGDAAQRSDTIYAEIGSELWRITTNSVLNSAGEWIKQGVIREQLTGLTSANNQVTEQEDAFGNIQITRRSVEASLWVETSRWRRRAGEEETCIGCGWQVRNLNWKSEDALGRMTEMAYDALGRQTNVTTDGAGARSYAYDSNGRPATVVDALGHVTGYQYDSETGRKTAQTNLQGVIYAMYDAQGKTTGTCGSATYPACYGYDIYGQMTGMTTYRGGSGGGMDDDALPGGQNAAWTLWQYDTASGLLTNKMYDDGHGSGYYHHRSDC